MAPKIKLGFSIFLLMIAATQAQNQPHILFVLVDDMGWNDVSFQGTGQIQTPNLDVLAASGVVLQQYYSEAVCTPARTALLTGKYPMRLGMQGLPLYNSEDRGIPMTERLLPSYLKQLGYSTHIVGKWHVGMSRNEYLPINRGFDSHYGMRGGFIDYYTYNKVETWPDGNTMFGLDLFDGYVPQNGERRYITDALTQNSVNIIERHNESIPLFLLVTYNAPHAGNAGGALQPPLDRPVGSDHVANSNRRLYANVVSSLDRNIGELVKALADKNILDNTIIVFASDNGAPTVGQFRNWGVNLPFRGRKFTPWEGAVRVPAFIWHANMKPRVWKGLMHITDWMPTLVEAAGGIIDREIDGVSQLQSLMYGGSSPRKEVLATMTDMGNRTYASYRAGDYKIIVGNTNGLDNGYYGKLLLLNKGHPPNYYDQLSQSVTTRALSSLGWILDFEQVEAMLKATEIKQIDLERDAVPCEPTLYHGCLYNVLRDPSESHNLWNKAHKIAKLLTRRLRALWAQMHKRGPLNLDEAANPKYYNYTWMPWIPDNQEDDEEYIDNDDNSIRYSIGEPDIQKGNDYFRYVDDPERPTVANVVDCTDNNGIKHFLCVLRSVF